MCGAAPGGEFFEGRVVAVVVQQPSQSPANILITSVTGQVLEVRAAIVPIAPVGEWSAVGELITNHQLVQNLMLARSFKQANEFGRLPAHGSKWRCRGHIGQRMQDTDGLCDPALFCEQARQVQTREMVASIGKAA